MQRLALVVAASCLLLACKSNSSSSGSSSGDGKPAVVDEAEKKDVAAIEAKLAYITTLKAALPPPTTTDGVMLDKEWVSTMWVHDMDLGGDLESTPKTPGPRVKDEAELRACTKEARHPDFGKHSLDRLSKCASLRYLKVVRTLARTDPKVVAQAEGMNNAKFAGCNANGDVLVYDLKEKKHVGGYRWTAKCDGSVVGETLTKHFEDNILEAIAAADRTHSKHP